MQRATRLVVVKGRRDIEILKSNTHGSEGRYEKILRGIEDPVTGADIEVIAVVRNGGVDDMHAKGRLTDRQKETADRLLALYETAHSDGMKAIDYSKINVDCMSGGDASGNHRSVRAIKELERIRAAFGFEAYATLLAIVVDGGSVRGIAERLCAMEGGSFNRKRERVAVRFMAALDALDALWNTAVGAGAGIRADVGEKTTLQVELAAVVVEATNEKGLAFVQGVAKLREGAAKRKAQT